MTEKFVNPPDWEKVEACTKEILKLIDEHDLTYIDKFCILSLVGSLNDRDFSIVYVMSFLKKIADKEEKDEKDKISSMYN